MGTSRSFLVAIERPLHAGLSGMPGASADAARLDAALDTAGYAKEHRVLLVDTYATLAAVESHWKKFRRSIRAGDRVVVGWLGRGHAGKGRGRFHCWDTLPDDRTGTSFAVRDWLADLHAMPVDEAVLLLAAPGIDADELTDGMDTSANLVALIAGRVDEEPYMPTEGGLWGDLIAEAIAGRNRAARDESGHVTARSIQKTLDATFPERLRRSGSPNHRQTPHLIGHAKGILRDPPTSESGPILDAGQLRRVALRSETTTALRDLADYRKSHVIPAKAGAASRRFVQRLAASDIRTDVERVALLCRESFGHARRHLAIAIGTDGTGSLRSPDFEYAVSVELDPGDSSRLCWRREFGRFGELELARSDVFGPEFDQLAFELARPIDVASFVDRLTGAPLSGVRVVESSDGESCELTLPGFAGTIEVRRQEVVVRGRTQRATGLFDCLLAFLTRFGPIDEPPALPPKR